MLVDMAAEGKVCAYMKRGSVEENQKGRQLLHTVSPLSY